MKQVETAINYVFTNKDLLKQAFTHKSYANESGQTAEDNEKLEFLGDAVLDLVIAEVLLRAYPKAQEGDLSRYRAYLVNENSLANQALRLGLPPFLLLGKSERIAQGELKPRLIASALEALLGAVYLDGGLGAARPVIKTVFSVELKSLGEPGKVLDYKTELQELVQSKMQKTPTYEILEEQGPSHDKVFTAAIKIADQVMAQGQGKTKKLAEQNAAQIYFEKFNADLSKSEVTKQEGQ
ncbi:MAG: ribonuclease III [Bdellovibrionota bacterium]